VECEEKQVQFWDNTTTLKFLHFRGDAGIDTVLMPLQKIWPNLIWDFYSGLNRKELLLGPLECHDDVRKRSLKQECFEMSPEWMQWLRRCNFARQIVPHARCSNLESSVADRWQLSCGAESSTTRYIGNTDERHEVTWCLIVQVSSLLPEPHGPIGRRWPPLP